MVAAAPAAAGGGVMVSDGTLDVSDLEVVASWDEGRERMLLDVGVVGRAAPGAVAAYVLATPSPAEITPADPAEIEAFRTLTRPTQEIENQWWPDLDSFSGKEEDALAQAVELPLDDAGIADLGAPGADATIAWFAERGLPLTEAEADVLRRYGDAGWAFAIIHFDAPTGSTASQGTLPVLEASFESPDLVVPALLIPTSGRELTLTTTVVGSGRLDRNDPMRGTQKVTFAGPVTLDDEGVLTDWLAPYGSSAWLTSATQTFTSSNPFSTDIRFSPSTYGTVDPGVTVELRRREMLGLPAGIVLTAGGMLVIALIGVTISQLMQRRRRY